MTSHLTPEQLCALRNLRDGIRKALGWDDDAPPAGFDYAPVKREGYSYNTETGESHQTTEKELRDARNNQSSWWMELRLEKGWTRERVHQEVEDWLNDCRWTTKPTRTPCL